MDDYDIATILICAAVLGLIPGYIAWRKGYPFLGWWFAGAALFIVALPIALFLKRDQEELDRRRMAERGEIRCPFCQEFISKNAVVCPHCRLDTERLPTVTNAMQQGKNADTYGPSHTLHGGIADSGLRTRVEKVREGQRGEEGFADVVSSAPRILQQGHDLSAIAQARGAVHAYEQTVRLNKIHAAVWSFMGPSTAWLAILAYSFLGLHSFSGLTPVDTTLLIVRNNWIVMLLGGLLGLAVAFRVKAKQNDDEKTTSKSWITTIVRAGLTFLAIVVGFSVLNKLENYGALEVEVQAGSILAVQNKGHERIHISGIRINGRSDCVLRQGVLGEGAFSAVDLKVGDLAIWNASCPIVRAVVQTDKGEFSYEF